MGQRDGMTGAEDLQYELILRTLTGTTETDGGHRNSKYVVAPNVEFTHYVYVLLFVAGLLFSRIILGVWGTRGKFMVCACTEFSKKESVLSVLCASLFESVAHSSRLRRRIPLHG